ncbi:BlaI/MecI/CopY family transcriptional regulator [Paenibacillus jiagnxiensis]|uniref:BlaI/MecI/CopY family transcriptional regulator n=1 Tax=Paenibacillus jiagnxiensis TaxID=3228926 RepID=UPI0038D4BFC2
MKNITLKRKGMEIIHITAAEMEIMRVIWDSGRRMTTKDIVEKLPNKKVTTVVTLAGRLIDKGVLSSVKLGRSHAHEYWAKISEEEYQKMQTKQFIHSIHKGSALSLINTLFKDEELTKEDIEELKKFINKKAIEND